MLLSTPLAKSTGVLFNIACLKLLHTLDEPEMHTKCIESVPHTLWGCAVKLASALTAATILPDAAVTPPSPK